MVKFKHTLKNEDYTYINFLMTLIWYFHKTKRLTITAVDGDYSHLNIAGKQYTIDYVVAQFIIAEGFAIKHPLVTDIYVSFYETGMFATPRKLLERLVEVTGLKTESSSLKSKKRYNL